MKTLPKSPYLSNIVKQWQIMTGYEPGPYFLDAGYGDWIKTLGFKVPVTGDNLEFPDDFTDGDMCIFILRWNE